MNQNWIVVYNSLPAFAAATLITLQIGVVSFIIALLIGAVVGVLRLRDTWYAKVLHGYVEFFRGTPLLVQLFFIYYGLPQVGIAVSPFAAAYAGLGLNGGAYISEIVRGAFAGVPKGQYDAASAQGLSWLQTMIFITGPQALRTAIPALVNSFSSILKDTSLVSVLAITEIMNLAKMLYSRTFRAFEIYLFIALIYFAFTLLISMLSKKLEKRLALSTAN